MRIKPKNVWVKDDTGAPLNLKRDIFMHFRVKEEELNWLDEQCKMLEMERSDFIRFMFSFYKTKFVPFWRNKKD